MYPRGCLAPGWNARHNPPMNERVNEREMVQNLSMARLGFGALALLAPRMFTRVWLGRGHAGRATSLLVRTWAARELALGMITLHELENESPSRRVVEVNAAVDGCDAVIGVLAWPALPRRSRLITVLGGVAAAALSANYLRSIPRA